MSLSSKLYITFIYVVNSLYVLLYYLLDFDKEHKLSKFFVVSYLLMFIYVAWHMFKHEKTTKKKAIWMFSFVYSLPIMIYVWRFGSKHHKDFQKEGVSNIVKTNKNKKLLLVGLSVLILALWVVFLLIKINYSDIVSPHE